MDWHHLDPASKDFGPCKGYTRSEAGFREELLGCICVSKDMHAVVHRILDRLSHEDRKVFSTLLWKSCRVTPARDVA